MSADVDDCTDALIGRAWRTESRHLSIGGAGFTLHYDLGCTLSGYDCERMKALRLARGQPVIDSRTMPSEAAWKLAVSGPMIVVGHAADEPSCHALSYVPLRIVAEAYRAAGAEALNLPGSPPPAERSSQSRPIP